MPKRNLLELMYMFDNDLVQKPTYNSYDRRLSTLIKEGSIEYQFICPGRKKKDLKVKIKGDSLWVTIPENRPYRLDVPSKYNIETVKAKYEDGILYITLEEIKTFEQEIIIE